MYDVVAWIYFWFGAIFFDVQINHRGTNYLRQEGYVFICVR